MEGTIAITGGSGHIGTALIQLLMDRQYTVRALYHTSKPTLQNNNLTWVQGDLNSSTVLNQLIQDAQVVVHCAAVVSIDDNSPDELFNINVNGTLSVINACLRNPNTRLIHISSSSVSDYKSGSNLMDEKLSYKNELDNSYEASKIKAEKAILTAVKEHGLNALILRPTAVVGPPDNQPSLLGQTILDLSNGTIPVITTGGYDMIDVRDLTQTIANSFSLGKNGQIYLLSGSYCSIKKLAQLANPKKNITTISTRFLLIFYPFIKLYLKITNSNLPLTRKSLKTLQESPENMSSIKAAKELNHNYRNIEHTVSDLLNWFDQNKIKNDNNSI